MLYLCYLQSTLRYAKNESFLFYMYQRNSHETKKVKELHTILDKHFH